VDTLAGRLGFALGQVLLVVAPPLVYHAFLKHPFNPRDAGFMLAVAGPPTLCFLLLAAAALWRRGAGFRLSRRVLWSTAIAGYVGLVLPTAVVLLLAAINPRFRYPMVQLVVVVGAMPVCVPLTMLTGFASGLAGEKQREARAGARS
jgi:hypothetical protein